jgi:hypothetical protein
MAKHGLRVLGDHITERARFRKAAKVKGIARLLEAGVAVEWPGGQMVKVAGYVVPWDALDKYSELPVEVVAFIAKGWAAGELAP